ncbi:ABC transporter ATP-binding protein [Kiloniella laminariae]|uniref:ABC transporter ATP-binding protein n=1 Tax=Kiloniella laminariae TaxID=454162 RepID=A0ABT4LP09_9PROT|nr:ABC transporter ATP-binding protein [Kiloniella laminariae]MCZ4282630.1 ABC transporter ATP-binding protein [Kiloniella laminariae]
MSALSLENVSHNFGNLAAVNDVSLSIEAGEFVCLLGPSGCGKTTALRIAAGLEMLQSGRVSMAGKVVSDGKVDLPPEERSVGLVFQDYALFPHLSVGKNVAFGLKHLGRAERRTRVLETLDQVGMADYLDAYPHTLSGGQQQRVALARAIAPRPRVVLLDEPFSGLDVRLRNQIRDETVRVLKENGAATLMVTHDPEEAMFMADRIAIMRDGRIVQAGPPFELYSRPADSFVAHFFGDVNEFASVCNQGNVETPFGRFATPDLIDGAAVNVLVRPEAVVVGEKINGTGVEAEVLRTRMLGRTSLVDFRVSNGSKHDLLIKARMGNQFSAEAGKKIILDLDRRFTFVFPAAHPKN